MADQRGLDAILIELNHEYCEMAAERILAGQKQGDLWHGVRDVVIETMALESAE